jgi:phage terminase large subunit GpA-like protein
MFKDLACQLMKSRQLGNVHLVYIYLVLHENKSMFIASVCQNLAHRLLSSTVRNLLLHVSGVLKCWVGHPHD